MLDVDPIQLKLAGTTLSATIDDAGPHLAATTGAECSSGFPGTCAAAHSALVEEWERQDRTLVTEFHSVAAQLHRSADDYIATDHTHAAELRTHSSSVESSITSPTKPLRL